jgi:hypothetical protein
MAILRQVQNHQNELTGIKGVIHSVETGLKWYGTIKGAYQVGQSLYRAGQAIAPVIAGLL